MTVCCSYIRSHLQSAGKSCFLFYILLRRLCEGLPTALQVFHDKILVFTHRGGMVYPIADFREDMLPHGTFALADSGPTISTPCPTFTETRRTFVIQATSPQLVRWKPWLSSKEGKEFWMDCNTEEELIALG